MLTLEKLNTGRPGLLLVLASVIALTCLGQVSSQQQENAKTKGPQAEKVSPAKTPSSVKRRFFLKPPPKNFKPPTSNFDEPVFDWGSVLQGEVVIHEFELKNLGGSPLKIERVKPSCGCTTVDFAKVIAPGGTGKITLRVDTKKFSGTIRKTAEVATNASKVTQRLTMTGKIELAVEVEPKLPRIQVVRGVPIKPLSISLKKAGSHEFKLNKVSTKDEFITLATKEVEPGGLYELTVTPKLPDDTRKYLYATIDANVTVNDKSFDLPIRVSITIKNRIEATPPSVYFSRRDTDKLGKAGAAPPSKQLRIKSLDPTHTFKITDVSMQGEHFSAKLDTVTPGKEYKLTVAYAKKPKAGTRRVIEKIKLTTDDPLLKEILINTTASLGSTILKRNFGSTKKVTSGSSAAGKTTVNPKVFGPVPPPKTGSK